jgi:hypothetical protein
MSAIACANCENHVPSTNVALVGERLLILTPEGVGDVPPGRYICTRCARHACGYAKTMGDQR